MKGGGGGTLVINGCLRRLRQYPCSSSSIWRGVHDTSNAFSHAPQIQRNPPFSSPFEFKLRTILRNEIQYQRDYAPPHQPAVEFDRFMVEDRPGEQWITLKGKSANDENIKIEATMFDGSILAPNSGDEGTEENTRLHISMLVDIWKGGGSDSMEFVCSAWPDSLEIQKVFIFRHDKYPRQPYMGPDVKKLNDKLQTGFYGFLDARGVNSDLSKFLHQYMMNKDRIELLRWLEKVESYLEK